MTDRPEDNSPSWKAAANLFKEQLKQLTLDLDRMRNAMAQQRVEIARLQKQLAEARTKTPTNEELVDNVATAALGYNYHCCTETGDLLDAAKAAVLARMREER